MIQARAYSGKAAKRRMAERALLVFKRSSRARTAALSTASRVETMG